MKPDKLDRLFAAAAKVAPPTAPVDFAGDVLEDKSQRLIAENSAQIGGLLMPVR